MQGLFADSNFTFAGTIAEQEPALLAKLKAELETVDGKIHALRAEGVGADIPDTLKLPEMDPEPELQTECADAACLTVDVA